MLMAKPKKHFHFHWITLAVIITFFLGILYLAIQQSLRLAANEPQTAMAQEVANGIKSGEKPEDLVKGRIDIASSATPFIIVYDQFGMPLAGNGYLNNSTPQVPIGVLAASKEGKTNSVTWQPQSHVRIASVSVQGGSFYVLGGRSLKTTEAKIDYITKWMVAIWLASILALFALHRLLSKKNQ